ncbi:MAG: hypothetical protein B7X56_05665 [Burkholderiales bacterium 34-67-9]|nr:MAG: hypothetical protein B7X56_05665 [Burkholderiales bacterium 34-67-9]
MAHWLKLQLADGLGVAAQVDFPLPSSFVWQVFNHLQPELPKRSHFDKQIVAWKLLRLLPDLVKQPECAPVAEYLHNDADGLKAHQLAQTIADVFDQYLVYRPDWLLNWEQGVDEVADTDVSLQPWQPPIWRALVADSQELGHSLAHRARLLEQLPALVAHYPQRLQALPLVEQGGALVVAMLDPLQFRVIDDLEFTTQRKILPVVSVSAEIGACIQKAYREVGLSELSNATAHPSGGAASARTGPTQGPQDAVQLAVELVGGAKDDFEEKPIEQSDNTLVRLINSMIAEAHQQGASDIHIEPYPGRQKLQIRFRVDGQMRNYLELPANYRNALVARIKIMCDLDISERRKPQDGKINFAKFGGIPIELRVATVPTAGGLEDVVLRLLSSTKPLALEQLHLNARNLQRFEALVERPYGLFLCVGPTGSGKTTTLHSALQRINTPNRKIWTAEDPVEITQRGLRQIQVNAKIGWNFANALRTLLRADPDVIMVGEIRDHETAEIAIEASLTGHLVFSTLHTNSAAETVVRLIDLGVDPFSFADSLQGVLAQRLVRRLCKHCEVERPLESAQIDELLRDYQALLPATHPLRQGHALLDEWMQAYAKDGRLLVRTAPGCEQCGHSGYAGRLALHELLCGSPDMRRLIQTRARPTEIQHLALDEGMRTLRQDGIEKLLQGLTSLAEVRSNTVG